MTGKNPHLEVVRGIAAFLVVIGHLFAKTPDSLLPKNHLTALLGNWGTEAVIIFFILSGIVIHSAFEKTPRNGNQFLVERAVRIHPILLISVLASVLLEIIYFNNNPSWKIILANCIPVATLQGHLAPVLFNTNPVIWSLSFEVFFYVIFGCLIVRRASVSNVKVNLWLFISISFIPILYHLSTKHVILAYITTMLAFSSIWLVGYLIWEYRMKIAIGRHNFFLSLFLLPLISRLHISHLFYDPLKYLIFALASVPFFTFLINCGKTLEARNNWAITSVQLIFYAISSIILIRDHTYTPVIKILYILLPAGTVFFIPEKTFHCAKQVYFFCIKPIFSRLGGISYGLYLVHYPVITFIFELPINPFLHIFSSIILFLAISTFLEKKMQPEINYLYKKYFKF